MNEDLKSALQTQGPRMGRAIYAYETKKANLDAFDANSRIKIKSDGVKRTESETDAMVIAAEGRGPVVLDMINAKAEMEGMKTDTQCLLAHVSLVCAETGASGRIAGAGQ